MEVLWSGDAGAPLVSVHGVSGLGVQVRRAPRQRGQNMMVKSMTPESDAWVQILAPPSVGCVTLGKLLKLSVLWWLHHKLLDNNVNPVGCHKD